MFEKLREKLRTREIERYMRKFDDEQAWHSNEIFGVWKDGRRNYKNGCYSIPKKKNYSGNWVMSLYTKTGKFLDDAEIMDIMDWHDDFVRVEKGTGYNWYYDCDGNYIICDGVFLTFEETGDNLYVVPTFADDSYLLYNHKERFLVCDLNDCVMHFNGFKGTTDENGNKVILAEKKGLEERFGIGSLSMGREYNKYYHIDFNGKILKEWVEM